MSGGIVRAVCLRSTLAVLFVLGTGLVAGAQGTPDGGVPPKPDAGAPPSGAAPAPDATSSDATSSDDGADAESEDAAAGDESMGLRAPDLEPPMMAMPGGDDDGDDDGPSPGDALSKLESGAPPSSDPTTGGWTAPQPILTLHGYLRARFELQDSFHLGRRTVPGAGGDWPFARFRTAEDGHVPAGGCGSEGSASSTAKCDSDALSFANMRFRLQPTISLSDDIRIHAQFDVFDNMVLG
ncbi:MAG: hypothetical protein KC417_12060, partial [Myxococcales bacterium]|nr:hypothetical protein [Myxococcales bacterium]